jgi:hypothetical protein
MNTTRSPPRLSPGLTARRLLGLAGCGFELRKAPVFAFKTLSVPGNFGLQPDTCAATRAAGTVTLIPAARARPTADAVLDILGENRDRVVLATNSAGEVRELELRLRVRSMQLASAQLGAHLQKGPAPLYTMHGDEPLLAQEAADAIRATRARRATPSARSTPSPARTSTGARCWPRAAR